MFIKRSLHKGFYHANIKSLDRILNFFFPPGGTAPFVLCFHGNCPVGLENSHPGDSRPVDIVGHPRREFAVLWGVSRAPEVELPSPAVCFYWFVCLFI